MSNKGLNNPLIVGSAIKNIAESTTSFVAKNKKKIIVGGALIIVGYTIYNKFFGKKPSLKFNPSEPIPKLTPQQAKDKATRLMNAMENPGTDEEEIYSTLAGLNFNDFVMVSNAFGMKYYDKVLGVEGGFLFNDKHDLTDWLRFELSNSELEQLQNVMPNVITFDNDIALNTDAITNSQAPIYKAEKKDGVWFKKELLENAPPNKNLGKVIQIKKDPFQSSLEFAIIDKPWSTTELWVETKFLKS